MTTTPSASAEFDREVDAALAIVSADRAAPAAQLPNVIDLASERARRRTRTSSPPR